ncbi:MAG: Crp/Fnr family transcriptional regulator [Chitinophagaceae bacterium]
MNNYLNDHKSLEDFTCTICECLNCLKHFEDVSSFDKKNLEGIVKKQEYKKGNSLFIEGHFAKGIYIIQKGKVKLAYTGINEKEQIIRLMKKGDLVGYRALINDEPYQASAVAIEDCFICFIPKDLFLDVLQKSPMMCFNIAKLLCKDLKFAEQRIVSLTQKNMRERMADALLFFIKEYGFSKDGQTIDVIFSRSEISDFVGTSIESAIRILSEFQKDKIIELDRKKINIINYNKLLNLSKG